MAGKIVADIIESAASQISLNVGNVTILTASSTGLALKTGSATAPGLTFSGYPTTGLYSPAANTLAFTAASTESMRITSSGFVGIGTNAPVRKLEVSDATDTQIRFTGTSAANGTQLVGYSTSDAVSFGVGGTSGGRFGATLAFIGSLTNVPLLLFTNSIERMRVTNAGLLGVNATSFPYTEQVRVSFPNTQGLHLNETTSSSSVNFIYLTKGSGPTNVGAAYYNGSTVAWQTTSDYRLKENIVPLTNALDVVKNLKPKSYRWKESQAEDTGFIAHELQELFPQAVSGQKDEVDEKGNPRYQGVDVSFLVATLTAAIQEQQVIITQLQADVAALKAK